MENKEIKTEKFVFPEITVFLFGAQDVITTSAPEDDDQNEGEKV